MKTISEPPLLLDTHVWIWMVDGRTEEVSPSCLVLLREAADHGRLRVSAVSAWELGLLHVRGRLRLEQEPESWLRAALTEPGIIAVPLDAEAALLSSRLPWPIHGDPADRLLIATARYQGWTLVTRDRRILDYARQGHLRAIDAGARVVRERRVRARRPRASRA